MRLVATDLDGTIVNHDRTISPDILAVLQECRSAGVRVLVVTGRPPRWLPPELDHLGGLSVCANGAVVYDRAAGRYVQTWTIEHTVLREIVDLLKRDVPGVHVAVETTDGFFREPGYHAVWQHDDTRIRSLEDLMDGSLQVYKILLRGPAEGPLADQMLAAVGPMLAGMLEATHSNSGDRLLEIGPRGVSKAATVELLATQWGIGARDVVAFGDQPNDIPLLRWAGRGYAMADGHPEARASADAIAPPCAQDGVAQVLRDLLR